MNPKTYFLTVQTVTNWATDGDFWELMLITNTEEWRTYMQVALDRGWPLAMLIQIHQKAGHFVAKKMYGVILDKIDYERKLIIWDIDDRFQYKISYAKVWRAKQKVFEMRFGTCEAGTYEASYDNLPHMLSAIVQRNPGSAADRSTPYAS